MQERAAEPQGDTDLWMNAGEECADNYVAEWFSEDLLWQASQHALSDSFPLLLQPEDFDVGGPFAGILPTGPRTCVAMLDS